MSRLPEPLGQMDHLLSHTLDAAELGLLWLDAQGYVEFANETFLRWAGLTTSVWRGMEVTQCIELTPQQQLALLNPPARHAKSQFLSLAPSGQRLMVTSHRLGLPGAPALALLLSEPQNHSEHQIIDALQREILEAVALGRPMQQVMDLLCRRVEAIAPDVVCTVLEVDDQGCLRPVAAPSIPAAYGQALDGLPIGPNVGSCGTAAWRREPVEVKDIANDPLWTPYKELALGYGLAACWSNPIFVSGDKVGATFALYYREPRSIAPFHRHMVEACVQLCQVALKHEHNKRQIERLAYFDNVTGLPNRTLFSDRAEQTLHMATRQEGQVAMLLLDMDRFKTINDSMGHAAGDQVLAKVATRLQATLREIDTLARLGGDEFVALLPGCCAHDAMLVAEKLHTALRANLPLPEFGIAELRLSGSIGISTFPGDGKTLSSLLKSADIAMYEAKRTGRNCTRYFLQTMNQELDERLRIESALRVALSAGHLQLHFQPKVHLQNLQLAGVEALLRWTDAQLGPVAPDVFIPIAEECGLINALDAWVLESACRQLAAWHEAGVAVPNVAVNVSALRFFQDDVAAHVGQLLERYQLAASQLTLEITERLLLDNAPQARSQLQALDVMGVRLSVDDFGTGYSSLSYLKQLPVSELKLDKSFVRDLETDADDRALSQAVISIGRALNLSVVAEGVETTAQYHVLRDLGCEVAQGYFFARPMAAADLPNWMAQSSPDRAF
ncbi:putative bifunctional diguanylate cyclase/phosphodiesterase [Roseateles koreensis]|uniref:EAL domain-containing protein n=1 Tax=Roseateles koreensis TaxID=2987526 RepID=A0ABT5KLJ3_9BURK|nr:EAL domain-containing protein [Roseateles koreensis]MDC8783779.1 EAL domain-containing protein [Roseateles koreensis]